MDGMLLKPEPGRDLPETKVPAGPPITIVDHINHILQISGTNPDFFVKFENFTPMPGDQPLDIEIFHNSSITLTLDTGNCDWEFSHTADVPPITLGAHGRTILYSNLTAPIDGNGRCTQASLQASLADGPGSDPYNMHVVIYTDPQTGAPFNPPVTRFIDPAFKNPGHTGFKPSAQHEFRWTHRAAREWRGVGLWLLRRIPGVR